MSSAAHAMTRVLLARHGEASYETDGSGDSGGSLTRDGREQAHHLGHRLADLAPTRLYCSELSRAVQTAEIAASVLSVAVEVRVGLQEFDVGDERGRPYNASLFEPLQLNWLRGRLSAGIPGGEDGHAVARRMFTVLDDIAARAAGEAVAVVSHGGAIIARARNHRSGGNRAADRRERRPALRRVRPRTSRRRLAGHRPRAPLTASADRGSRTGHSYHLSVI